MSAVIEKITLYDFFCYLLPGSIFISLLTVRGYHELDSKILNILQEYKSFFVLLFFLWGFLAGLILSELSRMILDFIDGRGMRYRYAKLIKQNANIEMDVLKESIEKIGLTENAVINNEDDLLKYLPAIYGSVQTDEKYKRIHNYASSEGLYKNMAASILFGGLPEIVYLINNFQGWFIWILILIWILSVILLIHRYYRFHIKKYTYSVIWLVEKAMSDSDTENRGQAI